MLRMLLELQAHTVVVAQAGLDALALAATERPDMAIVDLILPDIDGLDVIRALRNPGSPWRCICIALTNRDWPAAKEDANSAGANYFFLKRDDVVHLLKTVDRLA